MAIKRCVLPFTYWVDGVPHTYTAGQLVDATDPSVNGREAHFESVETHVADRTARIEQATSAPGEKRSVSTPRKPAARKPAPAKKKDTGQ